MQPNTDDDSDAIIKSPTSGEVKNKTITSFFKPKIAKSPAEDTLGSLHDRQVHAAVPPASTRRSPPKDTASDGGQRSKVNKRVENNGSLDPRTDVVREVKSSAAPSKQENLKSGDELKRSKVSKRGENENLLDPRKDDAEEINSLGASLKRDTLKSCEDAMGCDGSKHITSNPSTKREKNGSLTSKHGILDSQLRTSKKGIGEPKSKSSKKRKKEEELDSSLQDFEVEQRMKIPKNCPLEEDREQQDVKQQEPSSLNVCNSDTDVLQIEESFEAEDDSGNPREISFLDFLNESIGDEETTNVHLHSEKKTSPCHRAKTVQESTIQTNRNHEIKPHGLKDAQKVSKAGSEDSKKILKEKSQGKKKNTAEYYKKISQPRSIAGNAQSTKKSNKQNEPNGNKNEVTEGVGSKTSVPNKKMRDLPANNLPGRVCNDDSILTLSYSEFLDDESSSGQQIESPSMQLLYSSTKKKIVTVEAQVHNQPHAQMLRPADDQSALVSTDLVTIDLCLSPEDPRSAVSQKRTSNVVVSMSDLDLMIVSTDETSGANSKSKMVYSIFQKKGTMEKPKPTESSEDSKKAPPKVEQETSNVKTKCGRPRKCTKGEAKTSDDAPRETKGSTKKVQLKNQKGKRAKKTMYGPNTEEEENTEEEFEEERKRRSKDVSARKRRPAKTQRSHNKEATEDGRERCPKRSSLQAEMMVITSTPKSKNNKVRETCLVSSDLRTGLEMHTGLLDQVSSVFSFF